MSEKKIYGYRLIKAKCSMGTMENWVNIKDDHGIVWETGADPQNFCADKQPLINAADFKEGDNIPHFGRCNSEENPGNKFDLEEAFVGALIPGSTIIKELIGCGGCKCKPIIIDPWEGGDKRHLVGGVPALTKESRLYCRNGGYIFLVVEETKEEADESNDEAGSSGGGASF